MNCEIAEVRNLEDALATLCGRNAVSMCTDAVYVGNVTAAAALRTFGIETNISHCISILRKRLRSEHDEV